MTEKITKAQAEKAIQAGCKLVLQRGVLGQKPCAMIGLSTLRRDTARRLIEEMGLVVVERNHVTIKYTKAV
jgi:hypothetical protein